MLKYAFANWQTTSAGLTMIIGSVVHLIFTMEAKTATETVWTVSLTAVVAGIGLLFAGDASVSAAAHEETKQMLSAVVTKVNVNTDKLEGKADK